MKVATADGWVLGCEVLPPQGERRGVALLMHAMMCDRRSLRRLGEFLAARGWEVVLADLRGHGESGPLPPRGDWRYDDFVRCDVPALVEACRARGGPVVAVGHSLGSHTAAVSVGLGLTRPDAMVLLSANIWTRELEPSRRRRLRKRLQLAAFRGLAEARGYFPARRLRIGPANEGKSYVRDLAGLWRRPTSADGRDHYVHALTGVDVPVLSVIGRGDALMAHHVGARAWAARIPGAEFWLVGAGEHGLEFDPDHMSLACDGRSASLWGDVADWMAERVGTGRAP